MLPSDKTLVIAEIGVNHNGDLRLARHLVDIAKEVGADVAKFQAFEASELAIPPAPAADYQKRNRAKNLTQRKLLEELELSRDDLHELFRYCAQVGIEFMASGFSTSDIRFLDELGVKRMKVPSGEITNLPYLRAVGQGKRPVILSTGMSTLKEVASAIDVLESGGLSREFLTLLHCTTDYPAEFSDVNLLAMTRMAEAFGTEVGYSDHTEGVMVPPIAVALGAKVIEKHLTSDKSLRGPDHQASLNPQEFAAMVSSIRATELALGDGNKMPREREIANRDIVRKSLVASRNIEFGETFSEENLTAKRPGTGISPMRLGQVIGRVASRSYQQDEMIEL